MKELTRRSMLGAAGIVGTAAAASATPVEPIPATLEPVTIQEENDADDIWKDRAANLMTIAGREWWVKWTGWKATMHSSVVVCQFIAFPKTKKNDELRGIYSSFPGATSFFNLLDCFNVGAQEWQYDLAKSKEFAMLHRPTLAAAKQSAFESLTGFITARGHELTD